MPGHGACWVQFPVCSEGGAVGHLAPGLPQPLSLLPTLGLGEGLRCTADTVTGVLQEAGWGPTLGCLCRRAAKLWSAPPAAARLLPGVAGWAVARGRSVGSATQEGFREEAALGLGGEETQVLAGPPPGAACPRQGSVVCLPWQRPCRIAENQTPSGHPLLPAPLCRPRTPTLALCRPLPCGFPCPRGTRQGPLLRRSALPCLCLPGPAWNSHCAQGPFSLHPEENS